ncbi:hypothetical protein CIPOMA221M_24890 [Citrobacter portucalensis]
MECFVVRESKSWTEEMHYSGAIERGTGARAKGLHHLWLPLTLIGVDNITT